MKTEITNMCADLFGVPAAEIMGRKRLRHIVYARYALYTALRHRGWTFPQIGKFFGRHHTSVIHGVEVAEYLMERDRSYEEKIEAMAMWKPKSIPVQVEESEA